MYQITLTNELTGETLSATVYDLTWNDLPHAALEILINTLKERENKETSKSPNTSQ